MTSLRLFVRLRSADLLTSNIFELHQISYCDDFLLDELDTSCRVVNHKETENVMD